MCYFTLLAPSTIYFTQEMMSEDHDDSFQISIAKASDSSNTEAETTI